MPGSPGILAARSSTLIIIHFQGVRGFIAIEYDGWSSWCDVALIMHIASETNGDSLGMHLIAELPLMNIPARGGAEDNLSGKQFTESIFSFCS